AITEHSTRDRAIVEPSDDDAGDGVGGASELEEPAGVDGGAFGRAAAHAAARPALQELHLRQTHRDPPHPRLLRRLLLNLLVEACF
ncbi:hypothetical protein PCANC_25398, partial [Puccinia coronata f. sp. avenae]